MKKLTIASLIDFRKKNDKGKRAFVEKIKSNAIDLPKEGGGDYWITSFSAICNFFKQVNVQIINDKIDELQEKFNASRHTLSKNMYRRNITILENFKNIDIKRLRPNGKLIFLKRSEAKTLLSIRGLQVEAKPSHIYVFGDKDNRKVGAIWFTAKISGYKIEEVGMFCDLLWRFIKRNYAEEYEIVPKYCIAIDVLSGNMINFSEIVDGAVSKILTSTLDEINRLV